jgi:hypothetical protein
LLLGGHTYPEIKRTDEHRYILASQPTAPETLVHPQLLEENCEHFAVLLSPDGTHTQEKIAE